jgi:LysR family transcriptional regulator, regulator for bpeEF and oprC
MWLASEMAAFAYVSELKSFTAAAHALGVPKVAVSRAIVSLERRLGTRLLTRTTRRVALTPAGTLLRPHCQRLLTEVEAARARFAATSGAQRLRVVVDAGYGRMLVTPLVPRFLEHYGQITLQVTVADGLPSAPADAWDLMICSGCPGAEALAASALSSTPLGNPPMILCATPPYLARHGRPRVPADLAKHTVMRGRTREGGPDTLQLRRGSEEQTVWLRPALRVNDPALVHASVAASLGIGALPEFLCRQGLARDKLERVLADWSLSEPLELGAIYPQSQAESPVIRLFLEFLLANMVPALSEVS